VVGVEGGKAWLPYTLHSIGCASHPSVSQFTDFSPTTAPAKTSSRCPPTLVWSGWSQAPARWVHVHGTMPHRSVRISLWQRVSQWATQHKQFVRISLWHWVSQWATQHKHFVRISLWLWASQWVTQHKHFLSLPNNAPIGPSGYLSDSESHSGLLNTNTSISCS
jgi:hypothetical protein